MKQWIVTIKINSTKARFDQKITGVCQVSARCTDVKGAHHSFLMEAEDIGDAWKKTQRLSNVIGYSHVTRIEEVRMVY